MRRRRSFVPDSLVGLEPRLTLSHASAAAQALHVLQSRSIALVGVVLGTENRTNGSKPTQLSGQGNVAPLGAIRLTGKLRETGAEPTIFRATVTLRAGTGSVTVSLRGLRGGPQSATPRPISLTYTILGGTGSDRGAKGSGQASLDESIPISRGGSAMPTEPTLTLTFGNVSSPPVALSLLGSIQGNYIKFNDTGTTTYPYEFQQGAGTVDPLGSTTGAGYLSIQNGEPSTGDGALILTDNQGTVALHLSGFQGGPGALSHLTYSVLGGTGAYAGATGSGTVQLQFGGPILILDPYPGGPSGGREGSYSLSFGGASTPMLPLM
jgi:hypothetical protein